MQAHKNDFSHPPRRRTSLAPVFLVAVTLLGGCTQTISTPLPDLKRSDTGGILAPAQQQKAIDDLTKKKAEAEAQAVKQIEAKR